MSKAVQTVAVDIARLSMGMKPIFAGCGMLFDALGVKGEALRQVSGLADTVTTGKPVREEPSTDAAAKPSEDEPPFDTEENPPVQISVKRPHRRSPPTERTVPRSSSFSPPTAAAP